MTRLARRLGADGYHELHRISVEEPERFWPEVVDDLGIEFSRPWDAVVDLSNGPEWARWFVGGRINVARVCVHRWAAARPDDEALVWESEDGRRETLTWAEASRQVTRLAETLVELGVGEGDRVAIFMPMCPAVAVASHACAHVGAVQVPIFSGFAAPAIASAAPGLAGEGRDLRRLVAPARQADRDAGDARGGARGGRPRRPRGRRLEPGPRLLAGASSRGSRRRSHRSRSTRSPRTCSRTPPARPAGPRARSTSRAASSSRSPARSPTRRT